MNEKVYQFKRLVHLPRTKVWELLSHTDHLNRVSGLFSVHFSPAQFIDRTFFRYAEAKVFGVVPMKWREYPFEWVKEERYSVERVYESGPIKRLLWSLEFKGSDEQIGDQSATEIIGTARFLPANPLGLAAIPLVGVKSIKKIMEYVDLYIAENRTREFDRLPQEKRGWAVDKERLAKLSEQLHVVHRHTGQVERLIIHLTEHGDDEVLQMKPYQLADQWKEDRQQVLAMFLQATKIGLLKQSFTLMCPNCRVPKASAASMKDVKNEVHCDVCGVDYEMNFDRYIEMRFSVHPSIRQATDQTYCIGGPMTSPHVLGQYRLKPQEMEIVHYPALPGEMRIRLLQRNDQAAVYSAESPNEPELIVGETGFEKSSVSLNSEGGKFRIWNQTQSELVAVLEKVEWDPQAVTAANIASSQLFRDLFSKEVLSSDQQIGVESLTILFTDLKGSTSLYENIGDAKAYQQVYRHFDYLRKWISANNGAVVKTIGDSVMAAFYRPKDAVKAALEIQGNLKESQVKEMAIKIGLYTGPAIVVNANDLLDYFGHTVNMAARIQQQSQGHDVVVSYKEWTEEYEQSVSTFYACEMEVFRASLLGIQDEVELIRLTNIQ
ncbi:hypothetical protein JOC78_002438 [Bacillus ectoiniformans]|uniref:adenylate/guanylate cyclase domain-containing protein n=1 Tax=Bacillus ectoiniformans TaxID=1494429 RepID=UPI0019584657|nr:adenylate/guanylate cyclase domain-containing protein [Bacillus ectoiniformans]MBM7649485.1 hypothetical protein [Bacillus ectoiniformans]